MKKEKIADLKNIFLDIAQKHYKNTAAESDEESSVTPYADVICEDQYFGIIRIEKSTPSFCEWVLPPLYLKSKNKDEREKEKPDLREKRESVNKFIANNFLKTIVIVLESPHTNEFFKDNNKWQSIGPACGKTGKHLYLWLPEVLLKYFPFVVDEETKKAKYYSLKDIESGLYAIKLVNAIQFQCSLGKDTAECRDAVFSEMWDKNEAIDSFIKRVKEAHPDIIINCCTRGNIKTEKNTLRSKVQVAISQNFNCLLLRAAHPSSPKFKDGLFWIDEGEY